MARRLFCAFLAGGAVCFLLAVFLLIGPGKAEDLGAINSTGNGVNTVITIDGPTLTPPYTGLCSSHWYSFTNNLGNQAYLTLNAKDTSASDNSGKWQPNLPQNGFYLVEAYIPSHSTIQWTCPGFNTAVSTDTARANYAIHTSTKTVTVTIDQSTVQNGWKSLGRFAFKSGNGNSITLNDITGETNYTRTVSFSAIRFTYLGPIPIYFPMIGNETAKAVYLNSVSALDSTGRSRSAFTPPETVYWTATGVNYLGSPSTITYTRTLKSPCAPPAVSSGTLKIPEGNWAQVFTATVNTCSGLYNYIYQSNHQGYTTVFTATYSVNLPGFDICSIPTIPQMQTWWNLSPYYTMNLYTGGVSLSGCAKVHPDANWVQQASQQGWTFVPTWVGLQAPCGGWLHPMDPDPNKSRLQGIDEATQAAAASRALGFNGNHTIYYDLEYFPSSNSSCLRTVKSFLQGWIDQMHALNLTPGIYGIAGDFDIWATLTPPPDRAWLAAWYANFYDPNATLWMPSYIPNNLWSNHQRIRQYTGDHSETWGEVSLGIDTDVVDTKLVSATAGSQSPIGELVNPDSVGGDIGQTIQSIQFLTSGQGWALKAGQIYWARDSGESWQVLKRPDQGPILAANFLSDTQGWVASRDEETGAVQLYRTSDQGETWLASGPVLNPEDPPVSSVSFSFLDGQTGWAAYTFQTGSAFSLGALFSTQDGGETWSRLALPAGGVIYFTSRFEGWLQGGPGGGDIYRTGDGGQTWQKLEDGDPALNGFRLASVGLSLQSSKSSRSEANQILGSLPAGTLLASFSGPSAGWALVQEGACSGVKPKPGENLPADSQPLSCSSSERLLQTQDGGQNWEELSVR